MKITKNEQFNSTEIQFDTKPNEEIRNILKANKFRWHSVKKVWYGYKSIEEIEKALNNVSFKETKKEPKNDHSFKVGDVLESSWGYDQTNNSFIVVTRVSKKCIWFKKCYLAIKESFNEGFMCEDRIYDVTSVSIPDGAIEQRATVRNYDKNHRPEGECISPNSYQCFSKYNGEKLYCSWYA